VRVSDYRQDRILNELFHGHTELVDALERLRLDHASGGDLFEKLESLHKDARCREQLKSVVGRLGVRLRRDTDAILHLKHKKLASLFGAPDIRISFQNKVLVYLLYKCGGFFPSTQEIGAIVREHRIDERRVLIRHGTEFESQLTGVLSKELQERLDAARTAAGASFLLQPPEIAWPGGFFGFHGKSSDAPTLSDTVKASWRKEYLPGATEMLASSFCAAFAGHIVGTFHPTKRLRVTLHRTIQIGDEELLQQCCDYAGHSLGASQPVAGRTFPVKMATIGLAYRTRKIVRSKNGVSLAALGAAMDALQLTAATRKMANEVSFVAAVPLLEPDQARRFTRPSPVAGIIYIDAMDPGFFLFDEALTTAIQLAMDWIRQLEERSAFGRIRNLRYPLSDSDAVPPESIPASVSGALETVDAIPAPMTNGPLQFNYDHTDFVID
jgi:hypothetical protein